MLRVGGDASSTGAQEAALEVRGVPSRSSLSNKWPLSCTPTGDCPRRGPRPRFADIDATTGHESAIETAIPRLGKLEVEPPHHIAGLFGRNYRVEDFVEFVPALDASEEAGERLTPLLG